MKPIYQRIADDLREQISDGTLPPGSRLPTEADLREKYGTSARSTVRQGLSLLVNEGLIVPQRPKGYFVREIRPLVYRPQSEFRRRPPEVDIYTDLLAAEGDERRPAQDIEVSIVEPNITVRTRLQLKDELVAVRRRTRRLDGEAYNINDSYAPLSLVEGSEWMTPSDVARGTNQVLAELGKELVRALDEIYVRMPTPDEVRRLQLGPGTPVAEHVVTTYAADDSPVQVTINVVPGDRHVIVYERVKDPRDFEERPRSDWGAE
ncbi:GntR family transcriptional regulator [Streptomyces sp. NBC_00654]|uniref:GntR family transcriptional regulator n=1 Tax=Streptomyces sp. NBC_00654 TaxID=2975799 RepID=UPI002259546D|nr:GntR family transcriptional regulator [Streptomyces sp. NBC_00654]MCX4971254.1 GntR family transcriptional regulator [Streptomyces sp. NBC_00654]